jgi:oligosaccharide repeat unit polymerase
MTSTYVLMAIVLLLAVFSVTRLFRDRYPHPNDIATLSLLYYSIPVAVAAVLLQGRSYVFFLHSAAADVDLASQSMAYTVLAAISLQAGRQAASRIKHRPTKFQFELAPLDIAKTRIVLVALAGLIALGVILYGPTQFFAGYAVESNESTAMLGQGLIYLSIEWIGMMIAYSLIAAHAGTDPPPWGTVTLAVVALLFMAIVRGKRLEVLAALIPVAIFLFSTKRVLRAAHTRVCVLVAIALLVSLLASIRLGQLPTVASTTFNLVSEGFFAGHALPGILQKLNAHEIDYEYGVRFFAGIFAFVPRFLWPDKDEFLYAGNEALEGVAPLGATNVLAEVVLQGGAIAVILWFLFLGFVFERLYSAMRTFDKNLGSGRLVAGAVGYFVVVGSLIPHFRDGLIPAVKITLQTTAFMYVVLGIRLAPKFEWRVLRTTHHADVAS